ncbi:uncharacterized protein LOC127645158 [Xyrauchen texanus]|uniref:uncharacterized protein LOC127645158 n=1 Tax=Xyrauchen texanus TaxID=154827 RepID=UPI002241DFA9|nr:uncharacterized protein LOC127645158 [Xyrauchen texanus]
MMLLAFLLFFWLADDSLGSVITPVQTEVYQTEGENITLSCNISSAVTLFWYHQYPRSAPEFIFNFLHATGNILQKSKVMDLDTRFSGELNEKKTSMILEISSAKLTDSAMYYCALEPTQQRHTMPFSFTTMLTFVLLLLILTEGNSVKEGITPYSDAAFATERESVTLSCNYTGSVDSLHWYRQYTGSSPQFLILEYYGKSRYADPPVPGISINHRKESTSVDLEISSAAVSDSALYYCALQPTVTGKLCTPYKNLTDSLNAR